jgi:peptide/nickel transport system ATP-binding protein
MTPALQVTNLTTTFGHHGAPVTAVDAISFDVMPGEVLGLVGESGSGKSVTLRSIMRLMPHHSAVTGSAVWQGRDLMKMSEKDLRHIRGGEISMIFQEPTTALNPVLPVRVQIEENLRAHTDMAASQRAARCLELMDLVGISDAKRRLTQYPHQFSGGMRQRVMIAIALASTPKLLLADEPTTALDVTIQDQILKLILDLRDELAMSVVFVTHDLGVVAATCDRMAVMYAGRIVESGPVTQVFAHPNHAYTRGLLGSVPRSGTERSPLLSIEGTPPSLSNRPTGCAFHPRCEFATDICRSEVPALKASLQDGQHVMLQGALQDRTQGHLAACFHSDRVIAAGLAGS